MPRYDYKCKSQGHIFEVTQSYYDEAVAICPKDGSEAKRQFSVPHVIYKGSGFYTTDYGSSGNPKSSNGSEKTGTDNKKNKKNKSDNPKNDGSPNSKKVSPSKSKKPGKE